MYHFYVNKNRHENGAHEIHELNCSSIPDPMNRKYLGYFSDASEAIKEARKFYEPVKYCHTCCARFQDE